MRIVDDDTDATEGELSGEFDGIIQEGLEWDAKNGGRGWEGLETEAQDEDQVIALAYTSGTTARPKVSKCSPSRVFEVVADGDEKGVEFTHRGAYLGSVANVIESGLNSSKVMVTHKDRSKYLTILPLFHAVGWTFPWAVVSARATHYCLRTSSAV